MRVIADYRPSKLKRIKSLFLTALLLATAFFAGAIAEKTAHFLQDVIEVLPVAMEELKTFLRDNMIFKLNVPVDQLKWSVAIIVPILKDYIPSFIRGP